MQYSNIRADNIKDESGVNAPIFDSNLSFDSTDHLVLPKGTTAQRPSSPSTGAVRYNTDTSNVEYYDGTQWIEIIGLRSADKGFFVAGARSTANATNTINTVNIATKQDAQDFGALTINRSRMGGVGSSTRGIVAGGFRSSPAPGLSADIDYFTLTTSGNGIDWGNNLNGAKSFMGACSDSTRGVWAGGVVPSPGTTTNVIDYVTIASQGTPVTDFGGTISNSGQLGACASPTRGVFAGGYTIPTSAVDTIEYITIQTTGSPATNFGNLTIGRKTHAGCSNAIRGVFGGGVDPGNTELSSVDYITIASTGNALDFGDLTLARDEIAACAGSNRGIFGCGDGTPVNFSTVMDYVTIPTLGNAFDFGVLRTPGTFGGYKAKAGLSNGHGGLS